MAQASWDLDACARAVAGACTSGGSTVTIKGYYTNSSTGAFQLGTLNIGTDWMGVASKNGSGVVENTTSPNHAIDNYGGSGATYAELVHLQFTQAIDLTQIAAVWTYAGATTGDFQLWRWNDGTAAPTVTAYNPSAMTGWTAVKSADFGAALAQAVSDGPYFSSHWLVSTAFGGTNDAFKLGSINAASVCATSVDASGVCGGGGGGGGGVPEPGSLALAGLALAVVARQRRRR